MFKKSISNKSKMADGLHFEKR